MEEKVMIKENSTEIFKQMPPILQYVLGKTYLSELQIALG